MPPKRDKRKGGGGSAGGNNGTGGGGGGAGRRRGRSQDDERTQRFFVHGSRSQRGLVGERGVEARLNDAQAGGRERQEHKQQPREETHERQPHACGHRQSG